MPGVTKHIFDHEIKDIISMWNDEIKLIQPLLPREYTEDDIIGLLKHYFPYEWEYVESKYIYYQTKDHYLIKWKKARYKMHKPEVLIHHVDIFKKVLSNEYRKKHYDNYSEERLINAKENLWAKRKHKIERVKEKIEKALLKTQQVTPVFIDKLIGLYERKNTSQKDKVYILLELKKYYCKKIIQFFFKLNDTELNLQLRQEAFFHLQSFNFSPRLRRQKYMKVHTKNKKRKHYLKKIYSQENYTIPPNPDELEYRIENSKDQRIKSYDYFISHSSKDSKAVQDLIIAENKQGKNVFCDWISDVDYLKRHLLCEATLKVIEYRLQQSKALIFVDSENSRNSVWCKYELNYFLALKKNIYVISKSSIINKQFKISLLKDDWYVDAEYKNLALLEGKKIQ